LERKGEQEDAGVPHFYSRRQEGDYADYVVFTEEQVLPRMEKADVFIKAIISFLEIN
jgi:uncharacterized protein (UPF0332 family)